jgi:hypothetical protein
MSAATKLWISENTVDGLDVSIGLGRVKAGFQIFIQDYTSASRYVQFRVTADSIDKGTYWEIAVASVASAGTIPGGKVAYQQLSTAQTSTLFSTTTTAAGLTPGSNGAGATSFLNGNGGWSAPAGAALDADLVTIAGLTATTDNVIQSVSSAWASRTPAQLKTTLALVKGDVGLGNVDNTADTAKPISTATQTALDAKAPIRRTVKADTTTAYAPILTDENQMVTLSNASAITVTMPQNSAVAFPVGAEVDFVWYGVGQPTFAAGTGATVNGTPGLKLRARYSAATAKKVATNEWIIIGDLSA